MVPGFFRQLPAGACPPKKSRPQRRRLVLSTFLENQLAAGAAPHIHTDEISVGNWLVKFISPMITPVPPASWAKARRIPSKPFRGLTQEMLADAMHIQQPAIAKMERRTDMYISTLRSHIRAMGGELEITARFPDGSVKLPIFQILPCNPGFGL
jgi:hypothetical protein